MYSACLLSTAEYYVFCVDFRRKSLVLATLIVCHLDNRHLYLFAFFSITDKGVWVTYLFCSIDCYLDSILNSSSFHPWKSDLQLKLILGSKWRALHKSSFRKPLSHGVVTPESSLHLSKDTSEVLYKPKCLLWSNNNLLIFHYHQQIPYM